MKAPPRLHQFEGFFHVATHGGYARASRSMPDPVTEPALHQQVRKLEGSLGVRLLERAGARHMVLTPAGRRVFAYVAPFFEGLPALLRSISEDAGTLVVAHEALYASELCAPAVARLRAERPRAELRLLETEFEGMCAGLLKGDVDLGLSTLDVALPSGLSSLPLGELGLELLVPRGHRLSKRRPPFRPAWLLDEPLVVYPPGSAGRDYTEAALSRAEVPLTIAAEASSAATMRALVAAGVGAAVVPALLGSKPRPRRRTLPEGVVSFDLTESLRDLAGLPRFGVIRRAGAPSEGLSALFVRHARELLS